VAVLFCASSKICAIWVRSDVSGPSSGISTAFEDWRAEEARVDLSVPVLDLRVTDVDGVRVDRADGRPGMLCSWLAAPMSLSGVGFEASWIEIVDVWVAVYVRSKMGKAAAGKTTREDRDVTRLRHPQLHHLRYVNFLLPSIVDCALSPHNMFRTVARSFAATALRSAESISQIEAAQQTAINISKAQGIGQRGFIDGNNTFSYILLNILVSY
jgi:hypothetical protein